MSGVVSDLNPKRAHIVAQHANRERLPMWVVYRPTTTDFAGVWCARMHLSLPSLEITQFLIQGQSLDNVRAQLPPGLTCIGRQPNDDPVIE